MEKVRFKAKMGLQNDRNPYYLTLRFMNGLEARWLCFEGFARKPETDIELCPAKWVG